MRASHSDDFKTEISEDFDSLIKLHDYVKAFKIKNSAKVLAMFRSSEEGKFNKTINKTKPRVIGDEKPNDDPKYAKPQKTTHLSCTATCTYALAQYYDLWKETKQDVFGKMEYFDPLYKYWDYIAEALILEKEPGDRQALDEFSILNMLSFAKQIQKKVLEHQGDKPANPHDDIIKEAVNALCYHFVENRLAYVEAPHPFIYYKFLTTLDDWKHKLDAKKLRERIEKSGIVVENDTPDEKKGLQHDKLGNEHVTTKYDTGLFNWFWNIIYTSAKYELYRQVAFHEAKDLTLFDVKRLIYSLLIVSWKNRYSDTLLRNRALDIIFEEQLDTGLLPISHVVNNDFVMTPILAPNKTLERYEILKADVSASPLLLSFECFSDMLKNENIRKELRKYHQKLALAFNWANERLRRNRDDKLVGWYPEYESTHEAYSWVASHVLLFIKEYCSFISEITSESALSYFNATKIDKDITIYDTYNVKENIEQLKTKYSSALVFGPPGTGKSTIARYLARELGQKRYRRKEN